jgi:hypothetical protein
VLVTVTENLPQFSWINHAISIVPVSAEPHIFPERVTVNGTSIAPSGDTVSQTPPKPEGFTDEEWAELGEYTKRMWSDIMKALCEDSALPFAACGQLRSGALKTAIRNTQNALNLYPHGVPFRNAANQLVADDPATFGRRWAYATAELMRQIRLNSWFEDVSERNLITAVAGLAIASMQDRLVWPEQATWYTSSLTEAAKRAVSMNKFDVQAPDRLAEAMFYQGNLFPACAPTFHSAEYSQRSCQPSGGGGGGGGGGAGQLRAPVFP